MNKQKKRKIIKIMNKNKNIKKLKNKSSKLLQFIINLIFTNLIQIDIINILKFI